MSKVGSSPTLPNLHLCKPVNYPRIYKLMNIKNKITKYGIDKYEHFALASTFAWMCKWVALPILGWWAIPMSAIITLLMCIGKELIYDGLRGKGTPEWNDLWAGLAGIMIGCL